MTATAEAPLSSLLESPEDDRLELAERLQASVSDEEPEGEPISDEMKATLDRRWEETVSGKVKCIPHEEVIAKLRAKYGA